MERFVFVHGLMGWGSYDAPYRFMPYWGMSTGDLLKRLNKAGFPCFAASVAPTGSAWDRACELYAQLTGTRTDYGLAHAEKYGHARFGPDFTGKPLIPAWNEENPIHLLGHSFGGPTVILFSYLLTYGAQEEAEACVRAGEPDMVSPFFKGSQSALLRSVTTLAGVNNGTTAVGSGNVPDTAYYDMNPDVAYAASRDIRTAADIYYFAVPCNASVRQPDGTYRMDPKKTEKLYRDAGNFIGTHTGRTAGGLRIGHAWLPNDGLVNTVSAGAPAGHTAVNFDEDLPPRPGQWTVMPYYKGDHMSLMGGLTIRNKDIDRFYQNHLRLLQTLA